MISFSSSTVLDTIWPKWAQPYTLHKFNFIAANCKFAIVGKIQCHLRDWSSTHDTL